MTIQYVPRGKPEMEARMLNRQSQVVIWPAVSVWTTYRESAVRVTRMLKVAEQYAQAAISHTLMVSEATAVNSESFPRKSQYGCEYEIDIVARAIRKIIASFMIAPLISSKADARLTACG